MSNKEILEKYAKLILGVGVNIQEGQNLHISSEPIHWDFINVLEKEAYQKGACYIRNEVQSAMSKINRNSFQKDKYLDYVPSYFDKTIQTFIEEEWALIRFEGLEDPDIYENIDQKRNAITEKASREASKPLMSAIMNGKCSWTIAPLPTPGWAAKILGGSPSEDKVKELWDILIPILRLNHDDPVKAWKNHTDTLKRRIDFLNKEGLSYLNFTGPDTDLKIFLTKKSCWTGGALTSKKNLQFIPNLPTEEIFTTPDYGKTEGKVAVTRPVNVLGKYIEGAWFKFQEGKVVDFGAKTQKDQEVLNQYFEIDPLAQYLGEVALVDASSPIYQSEKTFYSILLDENAASHIALGRGISMAIEGGDTMSEEELKDIGCNQSLLHTDFMIGSKEVSVTGHKENGDSINIIQEGKFQI